MLEMEGNGMGNLSAFSYKLFSFRESLIQKASYRM
jgi:hypothetical protein